MQQIRSDTLISDAHVSDAQDFWATADGQCHPFFPDEFVSPIAPYRLYRFLTDLEDVLAAEPDDVQRIQAIAPLVRTLLTSSDWLQMEYREPHPEKGWSVKFLYREPKFPITVQMVSWSPQQRSTIHNHATWGIVALINGQEKNTFWRRSPTPEHPNRIEKVGEQILVPGDMIGFTPDAIHCVEALGDEPTISFNLYGVTAYDQRYKFDPDRHTAEKF
ncbi:MAG: cupin [Elainellaceae cyanobacterium]